MNSVLNITFIDILDVLLVTLLIYWLIRIISKTSARNIFTGIVLLYIVWIVARALNMKLLSFLLEQFLGVGVIALFVIFQPEIRRFLFRISTKYNSAISSKITRGLFRIPKSGEMSLENIDELVDACARMSSTRTGALIVIQHESPLEEYIQTGDVINSSINSRLIENIFFKNTPLHDGAMIVSHNKIVSARCTLPITSRQDIPPRYGMRHRAAIGVSEQTDATVVVVSEETGEVSVVSGGEIKQMKGVSDLRQALEKSYQ